MVVILCHWLCNALCAKKSVNSNGSTHNHIGILRGKREVSSDVCYGASHPKGVFVSVLQAVVSWALWSSISCGQERISSQEPGMMSQCHLWFSKLSLRVQNTPGIKPGFCYLAVSACHSWREETLVYFNAGKS